MLEEIRLFHEGKNTMNKIRETWDLLRDSKVFKKPTKYLEKLRNSKLFPTDFIESLFFSSPKDLVFTPHLATTECEGKKLQIISLTFRTY